MTRWRGAAALVALLTAAPVSAQPVPTAPADQARARGLTATAAVDVPLGYGPAPPAGEATQGDMLTRSPRVSLTLRYAPQGGGWFGRVTVFHYLDDGRKAPWNPDFTYSVGYDDWRPKTFGIAYGNEGGNRWRPDRDEGEVFTRLDEGTITATYRIPVPAALERIFVTRPDNRLSASVALHLTPRFQRDAGGPRGHWKRAASLSVRHRVHSYWYVEGRAVVYPSRVQQQPWDPDYTFGFGYFDWNPGRVSVQYGNYAGNRFPWRSPGRASFSDGTLTISYSHRW